MTCDLVRPYLEAYVDHELDAAQSLNLEEHLRSCEACSRLNARLEALHTVIAAEAPRYRAPDELRRRIQHDLRQKPVAWKWGAIAASLLLAGVALWQIRPHRGPDLIAAEIIASHVRSLMANHLVDEPSTDQHTVKPWFAGKLDFSPPVKNLDAQGFPLAGGRLDYIGNRPVAALVYRRGQHVINLYVWPSSQTAAESSATNGFNVLTWQSEGMRFTAISDLNPSELNQFSQAWRLSPTPNPHP